MKDHDRQALGNRKSEVEQRLDPSWQPETSSPVLGGARTTIEVSAKTRATEHGGLAAIHAMSIALGLPEAIDRRLHLLRRHIPYHESDHVLNLAYNVLCAGHCLEDLEKLRQDTAYLDLLGARRIPDPTTAGDFLRRFEEWDVFELMDAINEVRMQLWKRQRKIPKDLAILDVDGTLAPTFGECKEGMDISHKGTWGYHPLLVSLANTQEVLYLANRPGNRPSHENAPEYIDMAVDKVREGGFQRVRVRGDSDFSLTGHFDRWDEEGIEFVFGIDANPVFVERAARLPQTAWEPLERPRKRPASEKTRQRPKNVKADIIRAREFKNLRLHGERIAEIEYQPTRCQKTYRMIILEKNITVERGEVALADEIRYHFYVTNVSPRTLSAAQVVFQSNARCHQENVIEQLKNGVGAMRMPSDGLVSNWAYMVIAALAWNLKAWYGLVHPDAKLGRSVLRMEFRRFVRTFVRIVSQVLRQARGVILRVLQWTEGVASFMDLYEHVKRRCYA